MTVCILPKFHILAYHPHPPVGHEVSQIEIVRAEEYYSSLKAYYTENYDNCLQLNEHSIFGGTSVLWPTFQGSLSWVL